MSYIVLICGPVPYDYAVIRDWDKLTPGEKAEWVAGHVQQPWGFKHIADVFLSDTAKLVAERSPLMPEEKDVISRENTCCHCLLPIHRGEIGIRHYGDREAHSENRCLALLRMELTAALEAQKEAECELADYKSQHGEDAFLELSMELRAANEAKDAALEAQQKAERERDDVKLQFEDAVRGIQRLISQRDAARAEADQLRNDLIATKAALSFMESRWLENLALKAPERAKLLNMIADIQKQRNDFEMFLIKLGHKTGWGKDGRVSVDGKTFPEIEKAPEAEAPGAP